MSRADKTLGPAYFDAVYAADPDPWKFASSAYERDKYAATLAALPETPLCLGFRDRLLNRHSHARAGAPLRRPPCGHVAAAPLIEARHRCAALSNVRIEQMFVPAQWPIGVFDLVLLSEIVYYLCPADVVRLAARVRRALAFEGDVALVHWIGETDYPLTGDEAAELFIESMGQAVRVQRRERHDAFRLDIMRRL